MSKMPSIIFETNDRKFSIPTTNVQAIIKLPEVTPLPNSAENVRGLIRYRDSLYNLIDFRKSLSIKSVSDEIQEFTDMIDQREKDHVNWLNQLFESVKLNKKFTLTNDPHKCAFGKWYDNYNSKNSVINETLKKFDIPHKKIHSSAAIIEKLKENNKFEEAKNLVENTIKVELTYMKKLFSDIKIYYANEKHELAILFERDSKRIAVTVDKINAVAELAEVETKNLDESMFEFGDKEFLHGLRQTKDKELIISVSENYLF